MNLFAADATIEIIKDTTKLPTIMVENINVFDFELSDDDMAEILKLDTDTTLFGSHTDYDFVKYLLSVK